MFSANINDFMNQKRLLYITVICASILMGSCRQSKYVGEGNYLLKENEIFYAGLDKDSSQVWAGDHELIDEGAVSELIRPEKNSKFKLFVYNRIDTVRYKNQLQKKTEKTRHKNEKHQSQMSRLFHSQLVRAECVRCTWLLA